MKSIKIRLSITGSFLACAILISASSVSSQTKRGLLPTDLSSIKDVSDAQISPDGSSVVYVVSEAAPDRSRTVSRLWIVPTKGGESKRLTAGDASESTPRWSPDGKWIAFYSNRDKQDGLWIVSHEGGEPRLVTHTLRTNFHLKGAGESFTWAPDGKRIAFLSATEILNEAPPPPPPTDPKLAGLPPQVFRPLNREEIEKLPVEVREMLFRAQGQVFGQKPSSPVENAISVLPDDPRVVTRLQYKSRTSFSDNFRSHIFAVDIETRQLRQLTDGLSYEHSIDWSPKGDEIVFVSNREPDPDKVNNTDLFTVNVNTFGIRQLTKTKGCEWQPVFSPDGNQIAYIATKREVTTIDSVAEDAHAYIIPTGGGEPREASEGIDRRVSVVKWGRGPNLLYFAVADEGKTYVYEYNVTRAKNGAGKILESWPQITGLSFGKEPSLAWAEVHSTPLYPAEVYIHDVPSVLSDKSTPKRSESVSKANDKLLANLNLSQMREFRFKNEGIEAQGWVVPPINSTARLESELEGLQRTFGDQNPRVQGVRRQIEDLKKANPNEKYPVILSIHGGPHGMHGYAFNPTVQALAAHGYAVLLINPRGSSGYGQKFADGCVNDWGGGDYRDLMKGVDEALARFPFLDKDRMGVMGGSYGGYMTNWVITQTDRFKAAVASASLSNLISFYSTSLYQDLIHAEFNGHPWENGGNNYDLLWERSPLKHIKKAKTPLLLLHGEQDNDVHITQAEEMYTAMRMRGVECVFVRYPREGHGLREPRHREDSLARALQWFDRYLKQ
ncbi:MAG TPA: S9 family peptidase [Blastocatellia bacterium]|nr:S9 family peptidase [Blastocatellia bacterium]